MRFFAWIWRKIKDLFATMTRRTFLFLGFVLTWVVPIYLLNEQVALTQEVTTAWKFSFVGILVIVFCAIKFYGKLKAKIYSIQPKNKWQLTLQIILIVLQKVITLGGIAIALDYMVLFIGGANQWYQVSLIPMGVGLVCYLIDRIIIFRRNKRIALAKINALKEQIKGEIANGQ